MSPPNPSPAERRLQSLDILRAAAVALVLLRHSPGCSPEIYPKLSALHDFAVRGLFIDLFFVLSGFLVSSLLFREVNLTGGFRIGRFYIRRGFRIYPHYYVLVGITIVVDLIRGEILTPLNTLANLFFFQNYAKGFWGLYHTWSLAVEEHFYFTLPLILAGIQKFIPGRRGPFDRLPWVVLSVAALALVFRLLTPATIPLDYYQNHFPTHLRIDSLFFGVFLAYAHNSAWRDALVRFSSRWKYALLAGGVLGLAPPYFYPLETTRWISVIGFTLFYLSGGAIIVSALSWPRSESKWVRFIAYMGSHSYSIYLWHYAAATWLLYEFKVRAGHFIKVNWYMETAFYFGCSFAVGLAFSLLLEKPVLRIRDRLFPSRSRFGGRPPVPAPAAQPAIRTRA